MDQKSSEKPSRDLDMKGLGPWNTWPNRFAILDAKYYTMMYNRSRNHGVYIGTPCEPSNHSSDYGSRGDNTYYNNSLPPSNTHVSSARFPTEYERDLRLNDEHSTQDNKPQAKSPLGPVGVALDAERTVIGASYTLSLLQNTRHNQRPSRHGWDETKPSRRAKGMTLLSTVARGMCRRPGEALALCLEVQRNNLTAITQNQLYGDDVERGLRTVGVNEGIYLPVETDVPSLLQEMQKLDEKPDLVDRLAKYDPSNALEIAIRQTTQQWNGNKKVLLPLKEHIEVLARFDRKGAEWKKIPGGFDLAHDETVTYCLASSFELFRIAVIRSTLDNESVKRR
ncbi:hypothetical protein INS49_008150 [Diaporthe citri]|uniref:uncharacterized protein n=1 Tax=Diaporthe citri TaxID=83186 RepID=UPI001C7FF987|nr:uncharacterized protein INS49_008150 [Diaporthe citri]KAG6363055.1 hypothetical protein INS49_008150 [Diaporthe citri]